MSKISGYEARELQGVEFPTVFPGRQASLCILEQAALSQGASQKGTATHVYVYLESHEKGLHKSELAGRHKIITIKLWP